MVFSSILFLLYFFPFVVLIYYLIPKRLKNIFLLFSSLFFYAWGGPKFVIILLSTTILDFYIVERIHNETSAIRKNILLGFSIFITIGILLYFKYANFFMENMNELMVALNLHSYTWTKIILPIGISFFSFQKLTYATDVYNHKHKPFRNAGDYLLFITMFPQLIAGPIIRFNEIADQIESRKHTLDDFYGGFIRFIIGLSKKVLIANTLSIYAEFVFDGDISLLNSSDAWIGLLAYAFQIYFDFSGYSDMALGMGRMLGFRFPENFNNPYISGSISEFWRRWHMTLGTWMREYIYIPLGGNKVKTKGRLYFNLIFVFFVSGLWHGAAWNFVIWGLFHGLFLILDRIFLLKFLEKIGKAFSVPFTFFITLMGWVIFRIENLYNIKVFYKKLFMFDFSKFEFERLPEIVFVIFIATFFSFFTLTKIGKRAEYYFFHSNCDSKNKIFIYFFTGIVLFILSVSSLTATGYNPFIYFRF
jgi:alginate O-acetyltransferase complex protein AlgI